MHPDNKLANHGKQVTSDSRSQIPSVNKPAQQQGAVSHLGPKGVGTGGHGVKINQVSQGNSVLKAVSQSVSSVGGMLKTKSKRERSVSIDSVEPRDAISSAQETDAKGGGVMRSKRRCVVEKKQPYSGDEWCSGPDTEEDEEKPHRVSHRERVGAGTHQGLSGCSSAGPTSEPGVPALGRGVGPGLKAEPPQPSQQVVYVFTTNLANSAAEAVIKGKSDSILVFHQQNVPRTKLEKGHQLAKLPSLSEKASSSSSPPKSQSGTPRPASVGAGGHLHPAEPASTAGHSDTESSQSRPAGVPGNNVSVIAHKASGGHAVMPAGPHSGSAGGDGRGGMGVSASPSASPSVLSAHLQGDLGQRSGPAIMDGLSKEQLEHRERSLQTLRDIERLLLRSGPAGAPGDEGGPNNNNNPNNLLNSADGNGPLEDANNGTNNTGNGGNVLNTAALTPSGGMKKYEEPLQSMLSQTQSLGGPGMDSTHMEAPHNMPQHPHQHLSSPGLDMGPLLGPDGLTPEQIAWRKLQEEYYQEKRRQQEMQPHSQHFRMMTEMGMHGGGPVMMRGPPPPYHSKPGDQQWGPGAVMTGGMAGNTRMIDVHQEGPRGPRFLGHMQRGPSGEGGFPGSPGGGISMEAMGSQRPPRPGMVWLDDMPPGNMGGGGPFQRCYPGGPPQHLQGDPDRLLTREEVFHIMEKRQLQELHRFELERVAKQQQQQQQQHHHHLGRLGPRMMMDSHGGTGFSNMGMGRCPPSRGDPMDFPGQREMMGSPGGGVGSQIRDLMDSPMGNNLGMSMNAQMSAQQQMMLSQKLRGGPLGDVLSPEEIARFRAAQNGRGGGGGGGRGAKIMMAGPDGPLQFPSQGPFSGGPAEGGGYLQHPGAEMFGPDHQGPAQLGGTLRLSHMPLAGGLRGPDHGPCHPSDLSVNVNPMGSPTMPPPNQLKSPSLSQEASPLLPSPSAAALKSPSQVSSGGPHPPLPPASGAGTPSSSSMKSPQVMGGSSSHGGLRSPSASPGHMKSPAMHVGSPGWASPKTALPSPGGPTGSKGAGNGGSSSTETGPSLPPRSSSSTPSSQSGSISQSMPFTSSPDATPSQNPLSLIMTQMSKYAMPSSTPLYHDAIKTIATSDDEMQPDRPLLSGVSIGGNMGNPQTPQMLVSQSSMGPHSDPQSPMGMMLHGQQQMQSHDSSGAMITPPNPMSMPSMNPALMAGGPHEGMGHCNVSPMSQSQMSSFPRIQHPSHGPMHSPVGGLSHHFSQSNEDVLPPQQLHLLSKGLPTQRPPHPSDSFSSMGDGPDLSEVIRPSHTGIPEFDLSRIIPSDKPSSTLQYFPKSEPRQSPHQGHPGHHGHQAQQPTPQQLLKQLSNSSAPSSNPHIAHLQNMMAEQQLPPHPAHGGIRHNIGMPQGGPRGMVPGGGMGSMCPPGHMMGRTGMVSQQQLQQHHHHHQQQQQHQQAMMANSLLHHPSHSHTGMMSPQQHPHNLMAQQNLMMMQAKQRAMSIPGDHFGPQGHLMSPQGPMMGPTHSQPGMMGPQVLRQRGMSLDSPVGYGPGGMTNMPF